MKNNGSKKFDVVLMNPPYAQGLGEQFFSKVLDITNKLVTIQPTTWLFGKKQNKHITNKIKDAYCDITLVNPHNFDAGFLSNVSINYIDFLRAKNITLHNELNNKTYTYNSINDVTNLSLNTVLTAFNNIIKHLYLSDNLFSHHKKTYKLNEAELENIINNDYPLIRLAGIRGNKMGKDNTVNADFYTFISNSLAEQKNKVLITGHDLRTNVKAPMIFVLNDKTEQLGLFNYLKTDFARTCLSLIKNNQHLDRGELKYIPWFDFSNPAFSKSPKEIDDYLFKKYNISDDIRKHIETILPDYYNIR